MGRIEHGGDIYADAVRGKKLIDFSANISPLGLPGTVRRAVFCSLRHASVYPDPRCRILRTALAGFHNISADHIVAGNGAAELIHRIAHCFKPRSALLLAPSFSEYEAALVQSHCQVTHYLLPPPDFKLDDSFVDLITPELDIVFICNPNNPTGVLVQPLLMRRILERCEQTGTLLVADECFNDFVDEPEAHSLLPFLGRSSKLIILKAFTKFYAMAGLRLGYALCSDIQNAAALGGSGQPWPVSVLAETAALAALDASAYRVKLRILIHTERQRLKKGLESFGFTLTDSTANFLFFKITETSPFQIDSFYDRMIAAGILLRSCENFYSLDKSYYRTAIRTRSENRLLLSALQSSCKNTS